MPKLSAGQTLVCGLAGAATVTLVNETARRLLPNAPHLEELGIRGLAKGWRKTGQPLPSRHGLFWLSFAGDLIANGLFYSLAARGRREQAWARGSALGLLMGLGAATLPEPLGLGRRPTERTPITQALTAVWYLLGGLAAAGAATLLTGSDAQEGRADG